MLSKKLDAPSSSIFLNRWALFNFALFALMALMTFFGREHILFLLARTLCFWSTSLFLVLYLFRGKNEIFQMGYLTYLEATRKKIFFILILFALGTMGYAIFLPSVLPKDQLKVLQKICFTSATLFGAVIAIFLSASVLPKDIKDKTIFSIIPKPIRRFEYVLGRLFGCWMILGVFVFSMMIVCLGLVEWTLSRLHTEYPALSRDLSSARLPHRPVILLDTHRQEIRVCKNCFSRQLTASQKCLQAPEKKATDSAQEHSHDHEHDHSHDSHPEPKAPKICEPELFSVLQKQHPNLNVPVFDEVIFVYKNLPIQQFKGKTQEELESPLQIRFPVAEGLTRRIPFLFHFENPTTKERFSQKIYLPHSKEFWSAFPSKYIDEQGNLNVIVSRLHPDLNLASFGGLLIFGSVGYVEIIYVKSFFLLFLSLLLLSLLSLTCSTFLSTPVAVVSSSFLYLLGNMLDFLREFVEGLRKKGAGFFSPEENHGDHVHEAIAHSEESFSWMLQWLADVVDTFCRYFVDFTYFDLNHLLRIGVDIPFHLLGERVEYFVWYCFPLLAISYLSFHYRELS